MSKTEKFKMNKIVVFYDGNYFSEVSKFYRYHHERKARISFKGLHNFIKTEVGKLQKENQQSCQLMEKHYFRGRFSTEYSIRRNCLEKDRQFDDVLIREGIVPHYLPMDESGSIPHERGVDVLLAVEAMDLAWQKPFDILALIACDGDYVPLVRKLSTRGIQVILLAWDFKYDIAGRPRETRTSQSLISECAYPVMMHDEIDSRSRRDDLAIRDLFISGEKSPPMNSSRTIQVSTM